MVKIILFLLSFAVMLLIALVSKVNGQMAFIPSDATLLFYCIIAGGFGGAVYCLRAVYLNACVRKSWDKDWHPWYFIRPFVSLMCGGVSYVFLMAGLLVLEAGQKANSSNLGFLALAFISGLNVDKFVSKIEDLAQATWGIEKSRSSRVETVETPQNK